MNLPTRPQAEAYLAEAGQMNPGPWVQHSRLAAQAAEAIAGHHPELDPDNAYILGLLHDIGRREGIFSLRHLVDGYSYLIRQGYPDAARVCISHGLVLPNIDSLVGKKDFIPEQRAILEEFLAGLEYTPYDRLVQLCDVLALPTGFCLVETRLVDVALRYGVNPYSVERWKATLRIKRQFEQAIGQSIYAVLPGEVTLSYPFSL
jgi:hypothetical protein